jgi:hypothetical protein
MKTCVLCHELCSLEDEDNNKFNYFQFLWLCYQLLFNVFQFQVRYISFSFENKHSTKYCNLIYSCISGLSNSKDRFRANSVIQLDILGHNIYCHILSLFFTGKFFSVERFKGVKYVLYLIFQDMVGVLYVKIVTVKFYKYQNMHGPHHKALWTTRDPQAISLTCPIYIIAGQLF